jgi:hypothetical protein
LAPSFGGQKDDHTGVAAFTAEVARVNSLPLAQLAAEVMARGFGPDGPGGPGKPGTIEAPARLSVPRTTADRIAAEFSPAYRSRSVPVQLKVSLDYLIAEGLQVLEHACLVRVQSHRDIGGLDYAATRLGRAALAQGAVERVLAGGAL